MGIPQENVKEVVDPEATYGGVVKGFEWLKEKASDNSAVIVYYNGHGMLVSDINTDNKKRCSFYGPRNFLLPDYML
jgi:hypothetical protein